jgi:hypothetical protein
MLYHHSDGEHTYSIQDNDGNDKVVRMLAVSANLHALEAYLAAGFDVQLGPQWAVDKFGTVTDTVLYDKIRPVVGDLDERFGGWHPVTDIDLMSLKLRSYAEEIYARRSEISGTVDSVESQSLAEAVDISEAILVIVKQHPLWRFMRPYAFQAVPVGIVIGLIGDPRAFITPDHPYRSGKLKRHFGLDRVPQTTGLQSVRNMADFRYYALYSTRFVAGMWPMDPFTPLEHRLMEEDCETEEQAQETAKKLVRVELSKVLNYVRLIWLSILYPDLYPFDPDKFFQNTASSDYFKHHT